MTSPALAPSTSSLSPSSSSTFSPSPSSSSLVKREPHQQAVFDLLNKNFFPERRALLATILPEFPQELVLTIALYAWKYLFEPSECLFATPVNNNLNKRRDDGDKLNSDDDDGEKYEGDEGEGDAEDTEHRNVDQDVEEDEYEGENVYVYNKDIISLTRYNSTLVDKYVIVSECNEDAKLLDDLPLIVPASNCILVHIYDKNGEDEFYSMMGCLACGGCGFTGWKLNRGKWIFFDSNPRYKRKSNEAKEYRSRHNVTAILKSPPDILGKFF